MKRNGKSRKLHKPNGRAGGDRVVYRPGWIHARSFKTMGAFGPGILHSRKKIRQMMSPALRRVG